jgi:hypothetical protein
MFITGRDNHEVLKCAPGILVFNKGLTSGRKDQQYLGLLTR